jgi:hypothetical protein
MLNRYEYDIKSKGKDHLSKRKTKGQKRFLSTKPTEETIYSESEILYLNSLANPFQYKSVRIPSRFASVTQAGSASGFVTFSTNALGFARVYIKVSNGSIEVFNGVSSNETILGSSVVLLNAPNNNTLSRPVSAGLQLRSNASLNNEAGLILAYSSIVGHLQQYDVYRDGPHTTMYGKGDMAQVYYLPCDPAEMSLLSNSVTDNHGMGFMISGAVNQSYTMKYTYNYEYVSNVNTDTVPHVSSPIGSGEKVVLSLAHNNHTNPTLWTHIKDGATNLLKLGVNLVGNSVGEAMVERIPQLALTF